MTNQPPPVVTIDVAIFNEDHTKILLGRKPNQDKFRLIGGFVDINETFSQTVKREAKEETGVVLKNVKFVDSFVVDDWRYRPENNNIITALHTAEVQSGDVKPGDDIIEVEWVDFSDDLLYVIVDEHKPLIHKLMNLREIAMKKDKLYTVRVYYTTGDSFNTYNDEELIGMCWRNKDLAEQAVEEIREHYDIFTRFGMSDRKKKERASSFPWYNEEYSILLESDDGERMLVDAFWYGYFENLHYAEVVECDD